MSFITPIVSPLPPGSAVKLNSFVTFGVVELQFVVPDALSLPPALSPTIEVVNVVHSRSERTCQPVWHIFLPPFLVGSTRYQLYKAPVFEAELY
jgi:hypothetical protein